MMIMPSNNSSGLCHYYAGKYPGKIGWLNTPFSWKNPPFYMPYAIDNGAFTRWEPNQFLKILRKSTHYHNPLWIAVPDVVGDAESTLKKWHYWHRKIAPFGKLAFVAQDGMEPQDIPPEAYCVFIGGTNRFKGKADKFKGIASWLHIGRVNSPARVRWARELGADSIDGNGFFRGSIEQKRTFIEHFEGEKQKCLF